MHHSATPSTMTIESVVTIFSNNHKKRIKWSKKSSLGTYVQYHYIIARDWTYKKTRMRDEVWYHAGNLKVNKESVGICLLWNFENEKPSKAQYESAKKIIAEIKVVYPNITIHWHREFAKTLCPWKNFDFTQLQNIIMLFYEKLRKDNHEKTDKEKRVFKEPKAFIDRIKDLSIDEKFSELTYLVAILAEKLGK